MFRGKGDTNFGWRNEGTGTVAGDLKVSGGREFESSKNFISERKS
jgi:hypothetical protein